jgi:very-long-chain (3R)-3-hydroxyacyl-CoA dehydratase
MCVCVCLCTRAAYLALYNVASAAGWALILKIALVSYFVDNASPSEFYARVESPLKIVQSAAALEVLHALVGLVRSPVLTTALQVASRLLLVWGFTVPVAACHAHWSLYLMVGR